MIRFDRDKTVLNTLENTFNIKDEESLTKQIQNHEDCFPCLLNFKNTCEKSSEKGGGHSCGEMISYFIRTMCQYIQHILGEAVLGQEIHKKKPPYFHDHVIFLFQNTMC